MICLKVRFFDHENEYCLVTNKNRKILKFAQNPKGIYKAQKGQKIVPTSIFNNRKYI